MARVSTYLNFKNNTEAAFSFYKQVFKTEFEGEISRFSDIPAQEGMPPLPESNRNLIMHISLPILGGHMLMGTDAPESMGFKVNQGNNVYINLEPDSREETSRLFKALSEVVWLKWNYKTLFGAHTTAVVVINLVCNGCLIVLHNNY